MRLGSLTLLFRRSAGYTYINGSHYIGGMNMKRITRSGLRAAACFAVLLLAGGRVFGETITSTDEEWGRGLEEMTASLGQEPAPGLIPVPSPVSAEPEPVLDLKCGPWGVLCAKARSFKSASKGQADASPINTGFKALGKAGASGTIDGPGKQGNGTYTIVENEPYKVGIIIATGYLEGQLTLTRDPGTSGDRIDFSGKVWDKEKSCWGAQVAGTSSTKLSYDNRRDQGQIPWELNGALSEEKYWGGGKEGRTKMTIEIGGGWDHDFIRK